MFFWIMLCVWVNLVHCSDWKSLPDYTTVQRHEDSWATASSYGQYTKVLSQINPDQFVCFFAKHIKRRVHTLEVMVHKTSSRRIEINESRTIFGDLIPVNESSIRIILNEQTPFAEIQYCSKGRVWERSYKRYEQPGLTFDLRVCGGNLYICVGDHRELAVLPTYGGRRVRIQGFHFTPTFLKGDLESRCLLKDHLLRRALPSVYSLLRSFCYGTKAVVSSDETHLCYFFGVLGGQPEARDWGTVRKQKAVCKTIVRLCSNMNPDFELYSEGASKVTCLPLPGRLNTENTPYDLMSIRHVSVPKCDGGAEKSTILCALSLVGDCVDMQLYAARVPKRGPLLLLGNFYFSQLDLNRQACLTLYCDNNEPYLAYPIAKTLSLIWRFGPCAQDGLFYVCAAGCKEERITFFGDAQQMSWRQQVLGVPEIVLDHPDVSKIPFSKLNASGNRQALFVARLKKCALNILQFNYTIIPCDGHYYMCISASSPSRFVGDSVHEIDVHLSAEDIETHLLQFECRNSSIFVQLTPKNRLQLFFCRQMEELHVNLISDVCTKGLCAFSFCHGAVIQKCPASVPIRQELGRLYSGISYTCESEDWCVHAMNLIESDDAHLCYATQFMVCGGRAQMAWELQDTRVCQKRDCVMLMENDPSSGVIFYYAYRTYQNDMPVMTACGALCVDASVKGILARKAPNDHLHGITFASLQPWSVQAWPVFPAFLPFCFQEVPRFVEVTVDARVLLCSEDGHFYVGPTKNQCNDLLVRGLSVESVMGKDRWLTVLEP